MYKTKIKRELITIKVKIDLGNLVVLRINIIHLQEILILS
jgi:hypothetical protein